MQLVENKEDAKIAVGYDATFVSAQRPSIIPTQLKVSKVTPL